MILVLIRVVPIDLSCFTQGAAMESVRFFMARILPADDREDEPLGHVSMRVALAWPSRS